MGFPKQILRRKRKIQKHAIEQGKKNNLVNEFRFAGCIDAESWKIGKGRKEKDRKEANKEGKQTNLKDQCKVEDASWSDKEKWEVDQINFCEITKNRRWTKREESKGS